MRREIATGVWRLGPNLELMPRADALILGTGHLLQVGWIRSQQISLSLRVN
jgi:hypothetical protein